MYFLEIIIIINNNKFEKKKRHTLLCILLLFRTIVTYFSLKKLSVTPIFFLDSSSLY